MPDGGSGTGTPATTTGWKYKDVSTAAITSVVVKNDSITVRGGKAAWTYTLDEPAQGRVAVRLELGSGVTWCAAVPAKTTPSTAANDKVGKFVGQPKTPAPASCPATP